MNYEIKNDKITMVISSLGAEPQSLIFEGREYLWQGDKTYWFRRAPLLFPMIGPTKDNKISVEFLNQIDYNTLEEETTTNVLEITECDKAKYDKTVIILGDFFRISMVQYFSKIYKKVIYMHITDYKSNMIEKYDPDIMIFETVERYSRNLENFKIY